MGQITHIVQRGETLTKIAREAGTDVPTLLVDNPQLTEAKEGEKPRDAHGNLIYPGDEVVIKKGEFKCAAGGPGQPLFSCKYNDREGRETVTVAPYVTTSDGPAGPVIDGAGITFSFSLESLLGK